MSIIDSGADSEVHNTPDSFTLSDRRELIRQGLQLDELKQDILDVKVLVNDKSLSDKVRALEDKNLILEARIKTYLGIASLVAGSIATLVEMLHIYITK